MGDYSLKEDIYGRIFEDYKFFSTNGKIDESFIYQYLEKNRSNKALFRQNILDAWKKLQDDTIDKFTFIKIIIDAFAKKNQLYRGFENDKILVSIVITGLQLSKVEINAIESIDGGKKLREHINLLIEKMENIQENKELKIRINKIPMEELKLIKETLTRVPKQSFYDELTNCEKELKNGDMDIISCVEIIVNKLFKTPKFYQNTEENQGISIVVLLLKYGLAMAEDDSLISTEKKKIVQDKMKELKEKIETEKAEVVRNLKKMPESELFELISYLKKIALKTEIKNYFYEIGYSNKKNEKNENSIREKTDKSLSIIDAFCEEKGFLKTNKLTVEKCNVEYDKVVKSKKKKVIKPIKLKEETGVGLFIADVNHVLEDNIDWLEDIITNEIKEVKKVMEIEHKGKKVETEEVYKKKIEELEKEVEDVRSAVYIYAVTSLSCESEEIMYECGSTREKVHIHVRAERAIEDLELENISALNIIEFSDEDEEDIGNEEEYKLLSGIAKRQKSI